MTKTKGSTAVMAARRPKLEAPAPWQALEFFPTPPWATRALFAHVVPSLPDPATMTCWEPCAGLAHLRDVLGDVFDAVRATDVYNYPMEGGGDGGVPICEGGLDLAGSSATMVAWFVWLREPEAWRRPAPAAWLFTAPEELVVSLIPPCRDALTQPADRALARRCVPGWIAPSKLKKSGAAQTEMFA